MDHAIIVYLICMVLSGYGLCLFVWEWWRKRPAKPSNVFKAVTLLIAGVGFCVTMELSARVLWISNAAYYVPAQWYWGFRWYPVMIGLIYLTFHLTRKVLGKTDEP